MGEDEPQSKMYSFEMNDGDLADLESEILEKLSWLGHDELLYIHDDCCFLQGDSEAASNGKTYLLRVILRYLTSREVAESVDRGMAIFTRIKTAINSFEEAFLEGRDRKSGILGSLLKPSRDGKIDDFVTTRRKPEKLEKFEKPTYDMPLRENSDVNADEKDDFTPGNFSKSFDKRRASEVSDLKRLLRKELKIQGNVDKPVSGAGREDEGDKLCIKNIV